MTRVTPEPAFRRAPRRLARNLPFLELNGFLTGSASASEPGILNIDPLADPLFPVGPGDPVYPNCGKAAPQRLPGRMGTGVQERAQGVRHCRVAVTDPRRAPDPGCRHGR